MTKPKLEIDGTIRSLTIVERRNEHGTDEIGKIVAMSKEGDKAVITGPTKILNGYAPGEAVLVTMTRANKTLAEATNGK